MNFVIDLSAIPQTDPITFAWWFFVNIGWIVPVFLYFVVAPVFFWLNYVRNDYRRKRKYVLLAVDVPKNNEQTPLAIEQIFAHLTGAHQVINRFEKWWQGEINDSFSFEIVSLGGYIQFVIHLRDIYRDLVEAIIYAQYPDAEITEIEDYTNDWKIRFPNDKYELFGSELTLVKKQFYPIRTYHEFADQISGELKDPMASILEGLTRIGPGEQVWIQLVVTPADNDWGHAAMPAVKKLAGYPKAKKKNVLSGFYDEAVSQILPATSGESASKKDEPPSMMMHLTPGEKNVIEAIQKKISKVGFHTRIRIIYLADKDKFKKATGTKIVYGSFKQFNDLELNALKPDSRTATLGLVWFRKIRLIWRKNKILYRYRMRGHWLEPGFYGKVFNIEELASLWHFPLMTVKAPLVKKTESKKTEPPMALPIEQQKIVPIIKQGGAMKAGPPENLPIG